MFETYIFRCVSTYVYGHTDIGGGHPLQEFLTCVSSSPKGPRMNLEKKKLYFTDVLLRFGT